MIDSRDSRTTKIVNAFPYFLTMPRSSRSYDEIFYYDSDHKKYSLFEIGHADYDNQRRCRWGSLAYGFGDVGTYATSKTGGTWSNVGEVSNSYVNRINNIYGSNDSSWLYGVAKTSLNASAVSYVNSQKTFPMFRVSEIKTKLEPVYFKRNNVSMFEFLDRKNIESSVNDVICNSSTVDIRFRANTKPDYHGYLTEGIDCTVKATARKTNKTTEKMCAIRGGGIVFMENINVGPFVYQSLNLVKFLTSLTMKVCSDFLYKIYTAHGTTPTTSLLKFRDSWNWWYETSPWSE